MEVNHTSIDELDKRNPVIASELKSATLKSGSANDHSFMRTKSKLLLPEGQNNLTFDWVLMLLALNEHKELRTSKRFEARDNIYLVISIKTGKVFAVFGGECVKRRCGGLKPSLNLEFKIFGSDVFDSREIFHESLTPELNRAVKRHRLE